MPERTSSARRALGALCLTALVAVPAACGGDDDTSADASGSDSTTTTAAAAPLSDCSERLVEVATRDDLVEAAHDDADELPADAQDALDEVEEECGEELDALGDEEFAALVGRIDPVVAEYLGEQGTERHEFEETGSAISGG